MAQTTNIGLYKLGAQSKLKDFPSLFNDDLEIIDSSFGYGFGVSGAKTVKAMIDSVMDSLTLYNSSSYSIDTPPVFAGRFTSSCAGTNPSGVIGGTQWIVFTMLPNDSTTNYNAQLAVGFTYDAIAVRRKTNSTSWSTWKAIGVSNEISATSISAFQTALETRLSSMENGTVELVKIYGNWSGSPTGGARASGTIHRIDNGIYKVNIFDTCTNGYYYSGSWHWTRATMSVVSF